MGSSKPIRSALISVYHKEGLDEIIRLLHANQVILYSTGGSLDYIRSLGIEAIAVEDLTGYPSILDGRVKTLHPKIFGGILARREENHLAQLDKYEIPPIDLVIVDLYPFEQTVRNTNDEATIIEKIDVGGISLIRAAAKNYGDVLIVSSQEEYEPLHQLLMSKGANSEIEDRKHFATRAFRVTSHYDKNIYDYFNSDAKDASLKISMHDATPLRYGENPHQQAIYYGTKDASFQKLSGKELSYNNLVDVDAAIQLMYEFHNEAPTFAILKHTNACGIATRSDILTAWHDALAADPVSAFGGVLISNSTVDIATAKEINEIFYEVLIAPDFTSDATALLTSKKNRILLKLNHYPQTRQQVKTLLDGFIVQDLDKITEDESNLKTVTLRAPSSSEIDDLLFANKCVKHLKSNGIAIVKNAQLIGMGCGQTSRVDALKQAIAKANLFGFSLEGAVMASEAFFPFPDCVQIAHEAGITAVIHPGGSVKDQESIDYCNTINMAMVMTGYRHFKH
ncbi:MAG TPA: bifunctional phosphoribosylaminoimidazolecarboxamide formyltransferase/IMP cyclohydrolase [Saprospiraceae bacterium]|nr:bifunctional phosphoribosylaminoimidazolecarboxamide formyltransferase/IMP cyclohydrolase [Saprospiraceae bacterium]